MKKLILSFNFLLCFFNFSFSQNPLVKQWDKSFGGTNKDQLYSFQQTNDGGYIIGGASNSGVSGDKSQPVWGSWDFWIIKTDSLGNKQWDKDFGGTGFDGLAFLQQTSDGGYIFGGTSSSGISGDKTQANVGFDDYWILKTDSLGNKQWDKTFGGLKGEILYVLQQTNDGGYILGGSSFSGIGGDKSQANWDTSGLTFDYWIVKTDSSGNKQWDKTFGGTALDELTWLQQTTDGGYILAGASNSGISGDKTQDTIGKFDYWIVKTDSLGNKQWDKDFGGTDSEGHSCIQQTSDGSYFLGGQSSSGVGGDKTAPLWGNTVNIDFWILKIDSTGNKLWDKDYGGIFDEEFYTINKSTDVGFLVAGTSYSPISGDKTEPNLGVEQTWVLKADSSGNKEWDKTLQTASAQDDEQGLAFQSSDGCYIMGNFTDGGIGGDKTQSCWGNYDYWFIKFCDTTQTTSIHSMAEFKPMISVYPNPFLSEISITLQKPNFQKVTFQITDVLGQTIFNTEENNLSANYSKEIDLGFLSKGIYFLVAETDGERLARKIIKE